MPNPTGKGGWTKGQSGNPNGRPKKARALTTILKAAGSKAREDVDGKRRSGKRIIARALWELVSTGETALPREDGKYQIVVAGDGWFDVVKWLYQHIDGPPKLRTEVSGPGGGPIQTQETPADFSNLTDEELDAYIAICGKLGSGETGA